MRSNRARALLRLSFGVPAGALIFSGLAIATPAHAATRNAVASVPVDLSSYFDVPCVSTPSNAEGGSPGSLSPGNCDGNQYTFASDSVPTPGPVSHNGVRFVWPADGDMVASAVSASGQTISVSNARYSAVDLLVTSIQGDYDAFGQVTYVDGSIAQMEFSCLDWVSSKSLPSGLTIFLTADHQNRMGTGTRAGTPHIYHLVIPLDPTKTLASIQLPSTTTAEQTPEGWVFPQSPFGIGADLRIFAMSLESANGAASSAPASTPTPSPSGSPSPSPSGSPNPSPSPSPSDSPTPDPNGGTGVATPTPTAPVDNASVLGVTSSGVGSTPDTGAAPSAQRMAAAMGLLVGGLVLLALAWALPGRMLAPVAERPVAVRAETRHALRGGDSRRRAARRRILDELNTRQRP